MELFDTSSDSKPIYAIETSVFRPGSTTGDQNCVQGNEKSAVEIGRFAKSALNIAMARNGEKLL